MEYTVLPQTDLRVSKVCLGTMTWGQQNSESDGHSQMNYALEQGINFFDTAELYSIPPKAETYGATEKIIGSWFKKTGNRHKIVLASKMAGKASFTKHIRTTGFSKDSIKSAVEQSLKRLATDYIDLYQLHWPERKTNFFGQRGYKHDPADPWQDNINEVLSTLADLVEAGKIRFVGLSNETPWGTLRFLQESKIHGLPRMVTIQNPYSLLNRTFEIGLSEIALREDIKLLAYSPLGFGVLSGKYLNGNMPERARITLFPHYARYLSASAVNATRRYARLAEEHQISFAQMALAFVHSRPFVASTIIGATTMDQLSENIESLQTQLPPELMDQIDEIHQEIPNPAP